MSATEEVGPIFGEGDGPAQSMLRSPTVIILSIGLWGMNIYFFRLFKLDYVKILNLDLVKEREQEKSQDDDDRMTITEATSTSTPPSAIPFGSRIAWYKCVGLSVFLIILLHLSQYLYVDLKGGSSIGATFFFYSAFILAILFPLPSTKWVRVATKLVLQRMAALIHPRCFCIYTPPQGPRPIPFIDVFFADAMCSMSKVFFDWGWLFHMAWHYPDPVPKQLDSILIPSFFAAIPYLIRARQCWVMLQVGRYKNDPKRYQHALNAMKYASSIFPICLSAYQQTRPNPEAYEGTLIALLIINASYALSWDIIMDWGMFQDPTVVAQYACASGLMPGGDDHNSKPQSCGHAVMRPKLRFGVTASAAIALTDTVLRFSWLLRFHEAVLFPSKDVFILVCQLLEAFRRAIWNLLRVEWESIKHAKAASREAQSDDEDEEDDEIAPLFKPPQAQNIQMATPRRPSPTVRATATTGDDASSHASH